MRNGFIGRVKRSVREKDWTCISARLVSEWLLLQWTRSDDETFSDFSNVELDDTCISPGGIKCDRCPMLEKEVQQERSKCKSLEEVNKALLMDCNDFQAELQRLKQRLKELEWNVGMKNEKEKEAK